MAVLHFSHTGICVTDLARSLAFYRDVFGFKQHHTIHIDGAGPSKLLRIPDVDLEAIYLERDGTVIELLKFGEEAATTDPLPRQVNKPGITHFSFNVDDIQSLCTSIEAAGGRILWETQLGEFGDPVVVMMIADPDETLIELVESPADPKRLPMQPDDVMR